MSIFSCYLWLCITVYHMMCTIEFHQDIFVFCYVNYFWILHNVFQFILRNMFKNIPQIMMWNSFISLLRQGLALFRTAIARCFLAAFSPMSALAISSGQFFRSLHSAQLLCFMVVITSFQFLTTAFKSRSSTLVLCGYFQRKVVVQCFAGTFFRLICLRQEKMISVRWQVEEMIRWD